MKTKYFYLAALASLTLASCSSDDFVGDLSPSTSQVTNETKAINFGFNIQNATRAGEFVGATAAEKLGGMFVVEGTKGSEQTNSPSTDVVFDNYLVGYEYNSAGRTETNTNNWEYVGKQNGISGRMTADTWTALHGTGTAQAQTVKYWDYSTAQYDFIAWSTGLREAVTDAAVAGSKVKVTRINTGTTLSSNGFKLTAASAADLMQCYYTDINTVLKANYGAPVTLTFRNMAAKARIALYETVPGYSIKDVKFYTSDANPTAPTDLGSGTTTTATLFTMGSDVLPQSGEVTVFYPHIGTTHRDAPQTTDYNKASVTVGEVTGGATSPTQGFGTLEAQYGEEEAHEAAGNFYLGRSLPNATYAGSSADNYYTAVIPNTNGKPLTLRVDYTLVATDGAGEEIKVYGAKAVVPATYTVWQPNYAYTYVFKISDNSNGWTSQTYTDPKGLFPITFDAVVTNFIDANAEQATITTVATPSITTYQQGHDPKIVTNDEYSKSQTAGVSSDVKDVYVQVMDNSGATPALVTTLSATNSLLFAVSKANASEAEVMDALQNRTNTPVGETEPAAFKDASPKGRNGITLTTNPNISNTVTQIVNGVDDQPITVASGSAAKIAISSLATGTYAYVYASTVPSSEEKIYQVVSAATAETDFAKYYEVALDGTETPLASGTAAAGKVYFVKNVDANGDFVSYTFKQTKVGEDVTDLVEATIGANKANGYTAGNFYFDVYNKNNGEYAVKVIKVVN